MADSKPPAKPNTNLTQIVHNGAKPTRPPVKPIARANPRLTQPVRLSEKPPKSTK